MSTSGNGLVGTVLVVEDDRINRLVLKRSLEADGHVVTMADNGRVALETLEGALPDVILLDILMPELDGFAVLDSVKADPRLREIPVIMISALDEMDSVVRCIEAGADDYLPKPFDPTLLRARINAGLTKRRLAQVEQERVRDVFARFLPETVVDEVHARHERRATAGRCAPRRHGALQRPPRLHDVRRADGRRTSSSTCSTATSAR